MEIYAVQGRSPSVTLSCIQLVPGHQENKYKHLEVLKL